MKGAFKLNNIGKNIIAWYSPNRTVRKKTLKKVIKAWDFESQSSMTARNVVIPPLITAGPIVCNAFWARSKRVPETIANFGMSKRYDAFNIWMCITLYLFKNRSHIVLTWGDKEGMCNMRRIIHTKTNRHNDAATWYYIDCNIPEMQNPNYIY